MTNYKNLDFNKGCQLALANANRLIQTAELSKTVCLGIANSHLILASEEAIKADLLHRIALNPEWLEKIKLNDLFSRHGYKHAQSHRNELFDHLLENSFNAFVSAVESLSKIEDETETEKKLEEMVKNRKRGLVKVREKTRQDDVNKDWWENANKAKNLGFYVNMNEDKTDWISPTAISEEHFNRSFKIVNAFVRKIERQIN